MSDFRRPTPVLNPDRVVRLISIGGQERYRYTVSAVAAGTPAPGEPPPGELIEVMNDSEGLPKWQEMSRQTVNAATGARSSTPRGKTTLTQTVTPNVAQKSVTLAGGGVSDTLTVKLLKDRPSQISGKVGGVAVNLSNIAFTHGRLSAVSGLIGGQPCACEAWGQMFSVLQ